MKKNKMMRAAGVLCALTLITSCFVGGTFAKYVTKGEGTDTARVAKFGVEITSTGNTFAQTYKADDSSASTITNSVVSSGDDKLVAPGTKGEMARVSITGTPEVAVRVENKIVLTLNENWKDADQGFYCPLKFTVKQGTKTTVINGAEKASAEEISTALTEAVEAAKADYQANTNLADIAVEDNASDLTISWEWPFEVNDVKDTYLGNQAAGGSAATVKLDLTTTVTQID